MEPIRRIQGKRHPYAAVLTPRPAQLRGVFMAIVA